MPEGITPKRIFYFVTTMEARYRFRKISSKVYDDFLTRISRDYARVKTRDLFLGYPMPVEVFLPIMRTSENLSLERMLRRGQAYEPALLKQLSEEGIHSAFIRRKDESNFLRYFSKWVGETLRSNEFPSETKTQLLYDNAEIIVKKVFHEGPTFLNVSMGRNLVENIAFHLSVDSIPTQALLSIFSKDYYTFTHCVQVALLGMSFCAFLGWNREETIDFGLGALFHDIGKCAIDERILNKPGMLDKDQFELLKRHCILGFELLKNAHAMSKEQLRVVLQHHEGMDGSGYPDGLKAGEIHRYARVARIADCFDALTTKRAYKDAMPAIQAIALMHKELSQALDPELFKAFVDFLHLEDQIPEVFLGRRMNIELGNQITLEIRDGLELKASLVGMEQDLCLIVRTPKTTDTVHPFLPDTEIICRYLHSGFVYGFRSRVLHQMTDPFRFLFLSYPKSVESVSLRHDPRVDSFLPSDAVIGGQKFRGAITDLSIGGCRFVLRHGTEHRIPLVKVGEDLTIHTRLAGDAAHRSLSGTVRNVRVEEERTILGVQFMNLDDQTSIQLEKCIHEVLNLVK